MPQQNLVSAALTTANKQAVLQHLAQARQLLMPVLLLSLTPDERRGLAKMGDKTVAFVEKALDYAVKNPALVPPYLDVTEAAKDFALVAQLRELQRELTTLSQSVDDTLMVAGAEAYDAALIFHASVKGASRVNSPGSSAIYEDLVQRFPRGGRKPAEAPSVQPGA